MKTINPSINFKQPKQLYTSLLLVFLSHLAAAAQCIPAMTANDKAVPARFWSGDFFATLDKAKREHKPVLVVLTPISNRLVSTLSTDVNCRALAPFLKTRIPWTKEETNKLPISEDRKKIMRDLVEYGNGHLGWPTVVFLNESGKSVHVGAYLSPEEFPYDLAAAYTALQLPVPSYLERAQKVAVREIENDRLNSDELKDFWSGEYLAVIERASKENKPIFLALAPVDSGFAQNTLNNAEVRQALSSFLKTRIGVRESEKKQEHLLLKARIGDHAWPSEKVSEEATDREFCCIHGWPCWMFIDGAGKIIHRFGGLPQPTAFLRECTIAKKLMGSDPGVR